MTPNVASINAAVRYAFPNIPRIQTTNCRPIAGTSTWSQHAWGNAGDIFGDTATLDQVRDFLRSEFSAHIRVLLWRVKDHFDHVHYDPWPKGVGTPPCAGGILRVEHKNGTFGTVFTDDIFEEEMRTKEFVEGLQADPTRIDRLVDAGIIGGGNQAKAYWRGKLPNPDDPEWKNFVNAVEVETAIAAKLASQNNGGGGPLNIKLSGTATP